MVEVENLNYRYPGARLPALNRVSLCVEEGEFVLLIGPSGGGKSSLGRALAGLLPRFYGGTFGGRIFLAGRELAAFSPRELAQTVGIVFQDPERQLVMTTVEREVAFGLENLGLAHLDMARRITETLDFLGLAQLRHSPVHTLSGGQRQKVCLAAVLAMRPRLLVLDEPTSQLDPGGAEGFLHLVRRLNEETGLTVVLIEHRLERCYHLADRVVLLDRGEVAADGPPAETARVVMGRGLPFVPAVAGVFARAGFPDPPLTVRGGRLHLHRLNGNAVPQPPAETAPDGGPGGEGAAARLEKVWYTYPDGPEVLRGFTWEVPRGRLTAVFGPNGAGKSTLLKHLAGLLRPGRGTVTVLGRDTRRESAGGMARRVAYLAQDPRDYLLRDTVAEELNYSDQTNPSSVRDYQLGGTVAEEPALGAVFRADPVTGAAAAGAVIRLLGIGRLQEANPRDLSVGERQLVVLGALLLSEPELVLLDEPTRGLDPALKARLAGVLTGLRERGKTVVLATHDIDFAAECAQDALVVADGRPVGHGRLESVLCGALFYNSQIGRLFAGVAGVYRSADAVRWLAERRAAAPAERGIPL